MAAPEGNKFWEARTTHGRDKIFATSDDLWKAACEYFEDTSSRVWIKDDWVGKDAKKVERKTSPPFTLSGLFLFLDIDRATFDNYSTKEEYKDFFAVCSRIREVIWTQKFEGAAVGAFNPSIIASEIGLVSKKEMDLTTKGQTLNRGIDLSQCSDEQLELLQQLTEQCKPKQG